MSSRIDTEGYFTNGWTIVNNVFDAALMTKVATVASVCCDAELREENLEVLGIRGSAEKAVALKAQIKASLVDSGIDGQQLPRKLDAPFRKHAAFQAVALDSRLQSMAATLLGDDLSNIVILTDQLFMKPPKMGSAKPYHQDNFYFGVVDSGAIITAWIALEDADKGNGCLRYIQGSHRDGIVPHVCTDETAPYNLNAPTHVVIERGGGQEMPREQLAEVKQGGVVFHHGATMHASGVNTSDRWRRGYAIVYGARSKLSFDREDRRLINDAYYKQDWWPLEIK
eukprot:m.48641 g.48641  ORF g.48641 m.48641 type:complete len:283 (+) comp20809_c0_seq1:254-1102(+)